MAQRDVRTLILSSIQAEVERQALILAAEKAAYEAAEAAEQNALTHLEELPLMKGEFPEETYEGLCKQFFTNVSKVAGSNRTNDDVVACVKWARGILRDRMDAAYMDMLNERAQAMYTTLVDNGATPRDAQQRVGGAVYGPKLAKRQATFLPAEEDKKLWKAAKAAAFPQNYKRVGQVWIGRFQTPMPKTRGEVEGFWLVIPISQPEPLGEHPCKVLPVEEKVEKKEKLEVKPEVVDRVRPLALLESLRAQGKL